MSKKNPTWGGRFSKKVSPTALSFSSSIEVDKVMYEQDIKGSIAYAEALKEVKVLSNSEFNKIKTGLNKIKKKIESGNFSWKEALEDVHMNIESALEKEIGNAAKKLHTGRSRNDQVVTDLKLFLLEKNDLIEKELIKLLKTLAFKAEVEISTLMPGFTHLQTAQPISLAHHLLAWFEMIKRDLLRVKQSRASLLISPLGSGAMSGNRFKINREKEDIRHDVGIHSELSSVIKLGTENLNKHQMINVRIDLNGEVTISKPCNGCQDMINQLGINEVYYTDKNGIFKKL